MRNSNFLQPHILMGSNLIQFFRVILKLNFSIKGASIGRLFVSFFILMLFTPFRFMEAVLYFFAKKEEVKQPIFIIGHFRSGTTFLHDALNELGDVVAPRMIDCLYPYMNKYFQFMLVPILKKALPEERLMDKMKVTWDSPQEEEFALSLMTFDTSVSFLYAPNANFKQLNDSILLNEEKVKTKWLKAHLKFARKLQSMNKGKTLVFKSPSNTARVKELLEIYPDAKFIHIVRNPKDVIPSTLHLYTKILPEFSLQDASDIDLNEYVINFYEKVMDKYLQTKFDIPSSQLVELKYEEFVEAPIQVLTNVLKPLNLNLPIDDLTAFFAARKNFKRNDFKLMQEKTEGFQQRCAPVIKEYGY